MTPQFTDAGILPSNFKAENLGYEKHGNSLKTQFTLSKETLTQFLVKILRHFVVYSPTGSCNNWTSCNLLKCFNIVDFPLPIFPSILTTKGLPARSSTLQLFTPFTMSLERIRMNSKADKGPKCLILCTWLGWAWCCWWVEKILQDAASLPILYGGCLPGNLYFSAIDKSLPLDVLFLFQNTTRVTL